MPTDTTPGSPRNGCVGLDAELSLLEGLLTKAEAGSGGVAMVVGETGIGKTTLAEELAARARARGAFVLSGRCPEREWAPPYLPMAEALGTHIAGAAGDEGLAEDLAPHAGGLVRLVPQVRAAVGAVADPVALSPVEERTRLFDAVAGFLGARARRAPVVLFLDDLHWVDPGTAALLSHVAGAVSHSRLLVLGAYRDEGLAFSHPLLEVLGALRAEGGYERLKLEGLPLDALRQVLDASGQDLPKAVLAGVAEAALGNPLLMLQLARFLAEEGSLERAAALSGNLQAVFARRLAFLPEAQRRLLEAASVFEGSFLLDTVGPLAGLGPDAVAAAAAAAAAARLLSAEGDQWSVPSSQVRRAVYSALEPDRQASLHRAAAEALEAGWSTPPSPAQALEVASHYHASRELPGAERGVDHAVAAAADAVATGATEDAARFLRLAVDLLPAGDPRRPRLLGRLGCASAWALSFSEAVRVAAEAGAAVAGAEGAEAGAHCLAEAAFACQLAGSTPSAWALAAQGLALGPVRRDASWARLFLLDALRREAEDPEHPGMPRDIPGRAEAARLLRDADHDLLAPAVLTGVVASRREALASPNACLWYLWGGDYTRTLAVARAEGQAALARGQLARAARALTWTSSSACALGRLAEARADLEAAQSVQVRLGKPLLQLLFPRENLVTATDEGLEELAATLAPIAAAPPPDFAWLAGCLHAWAARLAARLGRTDSALDHLERLVPWLEGAPAWALGFPMVACHAAEVLWELDRLDHAHVIERALVDKVIAPDFRTPLVDGRLAMSRLCALQGRRDEARSWLAAARRVLGPDGVLPLLAVADLDEARMYLREDDADAAVAQAEFARSRFERLGMTGWVRRAQQLLDRPIRT